MKPICRGALYRDVSTDSTHGNLIRVRSVWVDEDGNTQVSVYERDETLGESDRQTVDLESFIDSINESIIRINSDHEAWEWRHDDLPEPVLFK